MTKSIPDGFHTITPHLVVSDAAKAIDFYKRAFGAHDDDRFMSPDGKHVMHAQLKIGDSMLMLGSEFPPHCLSPKSRGGRGGLRRKYEEDTGTRDGGGLTAWSTADNAKVGEAQRELLKSLRLSLT